MRMQHLVILLVMSFSAAISAAGDDNHTKAEMLANRLVSLMEIEKLYVDPVPDCVGEKAALSADLLALYRSQPAQFGAISPKSPQWSEVEVLYSKYRNALCSTVSPQKVASIYAAAYARNISTADLERTIAFYESPAGASVRAGNREIFLQLSSYMYSAMDEGAHVASAAFRRDLHALVERLPKPHSSSAP